MKCKNLMLALTSCIFVASCHKEEIETLPQNEGDVVFTVSMRTVARATETSFEEGDKIGVYAVRAQENTASQLLSNGNYADNVCYTYSGGKFVNQQGIVRPTDGGLRYYAIYPYTTSCGANFKFSVQSNQASSGQYTASDLCTAVSDVTADKEVDLTFSHRLSHVIINLEGEALGTGTATVELNNVNIGCDVDLNANTFTAYESRCTVVCADNGTNSYKAIIAPQIIEEGTVLLTITLNGKNYVFKTTSDIRFASGKQQVFNLVIEKDEIVSFTGEILPWGENAEPEPEPEPEQKVNIYIAGMYDGLWDGYVPCVWLNGEMHTLGVYNYDEGSVHGCGYAMAVSGDDVYVVGHQTPPLSSEVDMYYENATIWKNGAILYEGINLGLATTEDIMIYNNDIYAIGLGESGAPYLRINDEISWLPKRAENRSNWVQSIAESNGDIYIMGRNVTDGYNPYGKDEIFFWKNQELMDYKIEGDGICMAVQDGVIYCLVEKYEELFLWKNGQMTATGLEYSCREIGGPNFKPMFVDGEDVYIIGHQDNIAKIWKNGEITLLSNEDNNFSLAGIYVRDQNVYVVGYKVMYYEYPQYSIVKFWKNGEETTLDNGGWISYPCSIVVTPANE